MGCKSEAPIRFITSCIAFVSYHITSIIFHTSTACQINFTSLKLHVPYILIGASQSEPHNTEFYAFLGICFYPYTTSLLPEAPDACAHETYSNSCTLFSKALAVDPMLRDDRIATLLARPCLHAWMLHALRYAN